MKSLTLRSIPWHACSLIAALAVLSVGCSSGTPSADAKPAADTQQTPPVANGQQVPTDPVVPADVAAEDITKLQSDQKTAKAAFEAKTSDEELKKKYVVATVKLGTATMMSEKIDRKFKYVGALRLYREALKVDPTNVEAMKNKDLIESIYRDMKRPIPN